MLCYLSAWACLGVLGRAWACLGVLGHAGACLGHAWGMLGINLDVEMNKFL